MNLWMGVSSKLLSIDLGSCVSCEPDCPHQHALTVDGDEAMKIDEDRHRKISTYSTVTDVHKFGSSHY